LLQTTHSRRTQAKDVLAMSIFPSAEIKRQVLLESDDILFIYLAGIVSILCISLYASNDGIFVEIGAISGKRKVTHIII